MNDSKPQYQLQRVYENGTSTPPEITPVFEVPWQTGLGRRTMMGSVLTIGAALIGITGDARAASSAEKKCKKKNGYFWDKKKKKCVKKKSSSSGSSNSGGSSSGGSSSSSSTTVCTCNKVCTCVPVYY